MADLAIVLTVRRGSDRLPDKCLYQIKNKPLVYWIIQRLKRIKNAQVILATTTHEDDKELLAIAKQLKIPAYAGRNRDVVGRIDAAIRHLMPEAKQVLRALGDMPFMAAEIVERASEVLLNYPEYQAMLWHLPPEIWPVYGARELPYSREGWNKIARYTNDLEEREHPDLFFHRNRNRFKVLYHEPPELKYFRNYRLEVDYPEDAEMVKQIGEAIGMTKALAAVIDHLDNNEAIAILNRERVEKTGPLTSYQYYQRRLWMRYMTGQPVLGWDNRWRKPLSDRSNPIFCHRGHLLGFAQNGILHSEDGKIQLEAGKIKCRVDECGSSRVWSEAVQRGM